MRAPHFYKLAPSNWSRHRHKVCLFNLGKAEDSEQYKNNDLCLATNKNWPPHLFHIWGPIICELKGETPQEGINPGQSGDRARHGGQMAEEGRRAGRPFRVCVSAAAVSGQGRRGWDGLGSLISGGRREGQTKCLITGVTFRGTPGLEVGEV